MIELDTIVQADALEWLKTLEDESVHLIATDPPYMGVKDEAWDNQWASPADYLSWLAAYLEQFRRVLKPNGSLYLFASPQMAARVEVLTGEYLNVLNRITWQKPAYSTKAEMFDKDTMRAYFPASEAIIFAESFGAEAFATGDIGEHYFQPIQLQLNALRNGRSVKELAQKSGLPLSQVSHYFCASALGWRLPNQHALHAMGFDLNEIDLLEERQRLRREYEDLRRPFNATAQDAYTDVWTFRTVNTYPGKHPCEKPLDLCQQIVRISSRPGDIVLDCFAGSGAILDAARQLGRHYLGCDSDPHWATYARRRVSLPFILPMTGLLEQIDRDTTHPDGSVQLSLFGDGHGDETGK
jgi:DNA modification methylase